MNSLVKRRKKWVRKGKKITFPINTEFAFLKLAPSLSYSGASFLQCPHLPRVDTSKQQMQIMNTSLQTNESYHMHNERMMFIIFLY